MKRKIIAKGSNVIQMILTCHIVMLNLNHE